ncbi:MAG: LacI family transcriptional regulator, partial [Gammaproteobacteria bacterium]|nr:LacI family transcriptional regulator [Gammaproteobacteria bacterium]
GSASQDARDRVLKAADKLGYRPNAIARAMASGASMTIAAVIPDIASPYFSAVMRGLIDSARANGFEVLLTNTDNTPAMEERSIEVLAEKRVDGFVIAPVFQDNPRAIERLVNEGSAVVLLDRRMPALADVPLVSLDHVGASRLAAGHLLDLGHRRIAIVTEASPSGHERWATYADNASTLRPSQQRQLGFALAFAERGLPLDTAVVIHAEYTAESATAAFGRAIDTGPGFTAVYCTDAVLTYGAFRAVAQRRLAIPQQFSFVGFDDQNWTTVVSPPITVVNQPTHALGTAATNMLLELIRHPGATATDLQLPAQLVPRGSTAACGS